VSVSNTVTTKGPESEMKHVGTHRGVVLEKASRPEAKRNKVKEGEQNFVRTSSGKKANPQAQRKEKE